MGTIHLLGKYDVLCFGRGRVSTEPLTQESRDLLLFKAYADYHNTTLSFSEPLRTCLVGPIDLSCMIANAQLHELERHVAELLEACVHDDEFSTANQYCY